MRKIVTYFKNKLGGKPADTETRVVGSVVGFSLPYGKGAPVTEPTLCGVPARLVALPTKLRDESHAEVKANPRVVSKSHEAILNQLDQGVPLSRADIHSFTGISITSLCGRMDELMKRGQIEVAGSKVDPVTNRKVTTYKLKEVL